MDDLIKRLRDCANGIGSFKSQQGDYGLCDDAADRIEQLEVACWRMREDRDRAIGWRDHDTTRAEAAEAKLAKAVDMMNSLISMIQHAIGPGNDVFIEPDTDRKLSDARTTLAEIEGEK